MTIPLTITNSKTSDTKDELLRNIQTDGSAFPLKLADAIQAVIVANINSIKTLQRLGTGQTRIAPVRFVKATTVEATVRTTTAGKTAYYTALIITNTAGTTNQASFRESTAGSVAITASILGNTTVLLHNNGEPLLQVGSSANLTEELGSATEIIMTPIGYEEP